MCGFVFMMMVESYLPLYRKYRPQSLPELVGQSVVSETLSNAIELNQVGHAYLFTGPRGTGKTSSARIFAKALNCHKGASPTPCQVCDSCVNITRGVDMDVVEFDAASNSGVEEARNLIESSQFAPIAGRYKIYIIDEVHMLSNAAFNALLKTLEEPPPRVIFIFATTEAHKVLPTIVSRCQRFHFNRIRTPDIVNRLQWVMEQENLTLEPDALRYLARQARGGLRDALSSLDQVAILARSQSTPLTVEETIRFLGQVDELVSLNLLDYITHQNAKAVLEALKHLEQQGIEAPQVVNPLLQSLRFVLFAKAISPEPVTAEAIESSEAVAEEVNRLAQEMPPSILAGLVKGLHQLEQEMKRSAEPALTLETGLLSLTLKLDDACVESLMQRIEVLEKQLAQTPSTLPVAGYSVGHQVPVMLPPAMPPPLAVPPPPSGPPPYVPPAITQPQPVALPTPPPSSVSPSSVVSASPVAMPNGSEATGRAILAAIQSAGAKALFQQHTQLVSLEGHKITLRATNANILNMLQAPNRLKYYREAASKVLGIEATIAFETATIGGVAETEPPKKFEGATPITPQPVTLTFDRPSSPPPVVAPVLSPSSNPSPVAFVATPLVEEKPSPPQASRPLIMEDDDPGLDAMPSIRFEAPTLPEQSTDSARVEAVEDAPPSLWEDDSAVASLQIETDPPPETTEQLLEADPVSNVFPPSPSWPATPPTTLPLPRVPVSGSLFPAAMESPPMVENAICVKGKGDDWEASQTFVRNLLKASELTVLPDLSD
jgi:DNA polymerase III subunit gamma/tau